MLLVLALAAVVRLAALAVPAAPMPDADTYDRMAGGLIERGELREATGNRARVVPGYPLFLAGCRALLGSSDAAWRVPQALLGAATVLAVFLLARRLFGARAAVFAGLLAALDPFAVYFGTMELTETLGLGLLAWAALLAWRARGGEGDAPAAGAGFAMGAGLLAGLGLLTRPAVGMIAVILILGALLIPGAGRPQFKAALARACLALAIFVAALSPWWVRNW